MFCYTITRMHVDTFNLLLIIIILGLLMWRGVIAARVAVDARRRGFEPILDVPVTIKNPDQPIGTHIFTAVAKTETGLRWSVVTINDGADARTALDRIAATTGPGSFTGLRVGLAAIKALAEVLNKPIAAVSLLEVIAMISKQAGRVTTALEAGRGDVYVGVYEVSAPAAAGVRVVRGHPEVRACLRHGRRARDLGATPHGPAVRLRGVGRPAGRRPLPGGCAAADGEGRTHEPLLRGAVAALRGREK